MRFKYFLFSATLSTCHPLNYFLCSFLGVWAKKNHLNLNASTVSSSHQSISIKKVALPTGSWERSIFDNNSPWHCSRDAHDR